MKIKFLYSVLTALLLGSCSSDEIPAPTPAPKPAPETLDAYLSLGISNGQVQTKSVLRTGNGDLQGTTQINSLTVVIYRGEATTPTPTDGEEGTVAPETKGSLVYANTFDISKEAAKKQNLCVPGAFTDGDNQYQINGIKVKAGKLKVMILANMPQDFKPEVTQAAFEAQVYGQLLAEGFNSNNEDGSAPCSMQSKLQDVTLNPTTDNAVFYLFDNNKSVEATETTSTTATSNTDRVFEPNASGTYIPLYRNVSAIGLQSIKLDPAAGWGKTKGATLTLKSVFLANVMDKTSLTLGKVPADTKLYAGLQVEAKEGSLITTANEVDNRLAFDLNSQAIQSTGSSVTYPSEIADPIGKYFMAYENSEKMLTDGRTLLVLQANYTYIDDNGQTHNMDNRFYSVVVNDASNTGTGAGYAQYVERNYIYNIHLTVVGPGSLTPGEPLYTANATALVTAADWENGGIFNQEVE